MIARVAGLPDGTQFVGIDGFGAAGKTSLAAGIAAVVERAVVVHVDDFAAPDIAEWDWDRLRSEVLVPLIAGRWARYQVSRWDSGLSDEWRTVEPGAVVLVEGVSATRREIGAPWALTIWVAAAPEVRRQRAVARDGDAAWPVWEQQWLPAERAYAARERPWDRVDLVVDGTAPRTVPPQVVPPQVVPPQVVPPQVVPPQVVPPQVEPPQVVPPQVVPPQVEW